MTLRGRSRTGATSKMEHFAIIVNSWKSLTIITNSSILDVAAVLDPPLTLLRKNQVAFFLLFVILASILI